VNLSAGFIRRPVATTLLLAAVGLSGAAAFTLLPVSPLPQVDFPTSTGCSAYVSSRKGTLRLRRDFNHCWKDSM